MKSDMFWILIRQLDLHAMHRSMPINKPLQARVEARRNWIGVIGGGIHHVVQDKTEFQAMKELRQMAAGWGLRLVDFYPRGK